MPAEGIAYNHYAIKNVSKRLRDQSRKAEAAQTRRGVNGEGGERWDEKERMFRQVERT